MSTREARLPPNNFLFDCIERSWYALLHEHQLIHYGNIGVVDTSIDFDCLILTGGPDTLARHVTEDKLFLHALKLNKPIIGVCHGAFAVNDLTGGINGTVQGHDNTAHPITMEGEDYIVNSYHGQTVKSLGKDMIAIATDSEYNIEAFQHKDLPIYGIVWHPERMKDPVLPSAVRELIYPNQKNNA